MCAHIVSRIGNVVGIVATKTIARFSSHLSKYGLSTKHVGTSKNMWVIHSVSTFHTRNHSFGLSVMKSLWLPNKELGTSKNIRVRPFVITFHTSHDSFLAKSDEKSLQKALPTYFSSTHNNTQRICNGDVLCSPNEDFGRLNKANKALRVRFLNEFTNSQKEYSNP